VVGCQEGIWLVKSAVVAVLTTSLHTIEGPSLVCGDHRSTK